MRFIGVRHGESTWNARGLWQGQADPPLSDTGRLQARLVAARLAHETVDAVFCSDLARARETAEAIATACGVDVVRLTDLRERHAGAWQGLTRSEIEQRFPREWDAYRTHQDPRPRGGGETTAQMHSRTARALDRIGIAATDAGWRTLIVVSHGGPCRALGYLALGLSLRPGSPLVLAAPDNTALVELVSDQRGLRLTTYNDTAHLLVRGPVRGTALDG